MLRDLQGDVIAIAILIKLQKMVGRDSLTFGNANLKLGAHMLWRASMHLRERVAL